jgi:hypothetical protein
VKAKRMARAVRRGNMRPFGIPCKTRDHDAANFIAHSDVRCKNGGPRGHVDRDLTAD